MPSTPKGRNEKGQFRNKNAAFKAQVRRLVPVGPADDVFDMFAGDGEMYRRCWRPAAGATCDLEESCVELAATERPGWSVVRVNVERALRAGLWRDRPFSVVDIDCYGSPWRFLKCLFALRRRLADPCRLVLTDHYMGNRNLSHEDKTLGFRKPGTPDDYLACVDRLLKETVVAQGWAYDRKLYRHEKAVQHLITLRRATPGPGPGTAG